VGPPRLRQVDRQKVQPPAAVGIDARNADVQRSDGLLQARDLTGGHRRVDALHAGGDPLDRFLELLHAFVLAGQQCDREGPELFGKLVAQHGERRFLHGGHQHAPATGQPVANDVRNGMRLAGPRRPLHHYAVVGLEQLHHAHLFVVERLGEAQVARCCRPGADAAERR
jgi:hypothetical protein